jgi:hypothetical protein
MAVFYTKRKEIFENHSIGIKIAQEPLCWDDGILTIPLYFTAQVERLITALVNS